MNLDILVPFNGEVLPTKKLLSLGFSASSIKKLLDEGILEKTRRGYYQVTLQDNVDTMLMSYYLMNNLFDEFIDYYNSLSFKDYSAYYYRFMYDIMVSDYASAYKSLAKCCELNKNQANKVNLYAYVLLLHELMGLSSSKLTSLRNKIFKDKEDSLSLFLDCVIRKDYDNAYKCLRHSKDSLSKLEVKVLRDLSIKARNCYDKRNSPEMEEYRRLFSAFRDSVFNNDYDSAYYYLGRYYALALKLNLCDVRLMTYIDLFNCFNYIVDHPTIDLDDYKTRYQYHKNIVDNFYQAIKNNDYINALKFVNEIVKENSSDEFAIYKNLLGRIYNFLNIRTIIKKGNPNRHMSLNGLVKEKRYSEALQATINSNMDVHDKNIVSSLLESLIALDDNSLFTSNN